MEIRIGVQNVTREIVVETDKSSDDISALVTKALSGGVLDLMDVQGRRVVVPSSALALRADRRRGQAPRGLRRLVAPHGTIA